MENILSSLAGLCLLPQPPHVLLHRLLKPQPWPGVNVRLRAKNDKIQREMEKFQNNQPYKGYI